MGSGSKVQISSKDKKPSANTLIKVEIWNLGNTPSLNLGENDVLLLNSVIPDEFTFPTTPLNSNLNLGPNQMVYVHQQISLTAQQIGLVNTEKSLLICAGRLKYQDVFGSERETTWCYLYSPKHDAFIVADKHNRVV